MPKTILLVLIICFCINKSHAIKVIPKIKCKILSSYGQKQNKFVYLAEKDSWANRRTKGMGIDGYIIYGKEVYLLGKYEGDGNIDNYEAISLSNPFNIANLYMSKPIPVTRILTATKAEISFQKESGEFHYLKLKCRKLRRKYKIIEV